MLVYRGQTYIIISMYLTMFDALHCYFLECGKAIQHGGYTLHQTSGQSIDHGNTQNHQPHSSSNNQCDSNPSFTSKKSG